MEYGTKLEVFDKHHRFRFLWTATTKRRIISFNFVFLVYKSNVFEQNVKLSWFFATQVYTPRRECIFLRAKVSRMALPWVFEFLLFLMAKESGKGRKAKNFIQNFFLLWRFFCANTRTTQTREIGSIGTCGTWYINNNNRSILFVCQKCWT